MIDRPGFRHRKALLVLVTFSLLLPGSCATVDHITEGGAEQNGEPRDARNQERSLSPLFPHPVPPYRGMVEVSLPIPQPSLPETVLPFPAPQAGHGVRDLSFSLPDLRVPSPPEPEADMLVPPTPGADVPAPVKTPLPRVVERTFPYDVTLPAAEIPEADRDPLLGTDAASLSTPAPTEPTVSTPPTPPAAAATPAGPSAPAARDTAPRERPAPPEPTLLRGERAVEPGERFSLTLAGSGWIYLGSSAPIDFISRRREENEVVFSFRMHRTEDQEPLELRFESQDLATGLRLLHQEIVVSSAASPARADPDPEGRTASRDELAPTGGDAGPDLTEQLRAAVAAKGPLTPEEAPLIQELLARMDGRSSEDETFPRETLALTERLVAADDAAGAIPLLEALLSSGSTRYDYLLYTLASMYERTGPNRDLARSRHLYRRLVQEYPLSDYWERATRRIEYLERHFFFIR